MNNDSLPANVGSNDGLGVLPEQAGWAMKMHGSLVLFANNAEHARGMSPGATEPVFTADQMRVYAQQERQRVAELWAGCTTEAEGHGLVDIGASIRAGRLVDA